METETETETETKTETNTETENKTKTDINPKERKCVKPKTGKAPTADRRSS